MSETVDSINIPELNHSGNAFSFGIDLEDGVVAFLCKRFDGAVFTVATFQVETAKRLRNNLDKNIKDLEERM